MSGKPEKTIEHPSFVMSKYLTKADLYKDKAEYYQAKVAELEADLAKPNEWISCSSRLPDSGDYVLLTDGSTVDRGYRENGQFYEHDRPDYPSLTNETVTHWQPLPSPPTTSQGCEGGYCELCPEIKRKECGV